MTRSVRLRVAFQGERGAFSEDAARKLLGHRIVSVPRANFVQLFRAIRDGLADVILAPVENSLVGAVQPVHDLLLSSRLHIVGEVVRPIVHCLIGCPGASFSKLNAVQSHPVALAQCERFFAARPHLQRIAADDTAGSVREVTERGDLRRAAIAGELAARVYGGRILRRHLEDHRKNFTRFFLLDPSTRPARGADKLSVVFELRHQPGALLRALDPFARRGLNLLKIGSRPIPGRPWEYRFYLDVRARAGALLTLALKDLKRASSRLRVLGHYPSAKEG